MRDRPLKIMAVTGSRADWGYLSVPLSLLRGDPAFELVLMVTGQHLDAASGATAHAIEAEGFRIDARVDMTLTGDDAASVTRAMGHGLSGMGPVVAEHAPDLMMVLGDRYEILAAATAALLARVPVAHIAGGDMTEGAVDDAIRHAITKLSHLHFPSTSVAASRIIRMGENPRHVHAVGSTGLDRLLRVAHQPRAAFFAGVGLVPRQKNILVTVHPVTLAPDPLADAAAVLEALHRLGPETGILLTGTNTDAGSGRLGTMVKDFAAAHDNAVLHPSLGTERYVNAMLHCDAVLGNSSSGLYEAPSLAIPTVNVGIRQQGRLRAASVIDVPGDPQAIIDGLAAAFRLDVSGVTNPYGDGEASRRIVAVLKDLKDPETLLRKTFYSGDAS